MKKRWNQIAARGILLMSLTAVTAAAGLTACSSAPKQTTEVLSQEAMEGAGGGGTQEQGIVSQSVMDAAPGEMANEGLTDPAAAENEGMKLPSGRKLIRNVEMDVETDAFDALLSQITTRLSEAGGYVEQSDTSGRRGSRQNEPKPRSARITARVPSDKLNGFVTAVEENGNVVNKSETARDVTLQYSDLESKRKSLTIEQERIWALLEKADTLEAVITLEERLSELRYELESMESQLRLYDNQVDYSTVILRISEVKTFTPTAPETVGQRIRNGFSRNLDGAVQLILNLFIGLAAGSPIWLPPAVLAVLLLFLCRKYGRRRKAVKKEPAEKPAEKQSS